MNGLMVKRSRGFKKMGESKDERGQKPAPSRTEPRNHLRLKKTAKKSLLQQRNDERGGKCLKKAGRDSPGR